MSSEIYQFSVGQLRCTAINDGSYVYTAANYFSNARQPELDQRLQQHGLQPEAIASPFTCLLVETGRQRVLIDTGSGGLTPTAGRLPQILDDLGIQPESIDVVLLTHAHPDHIGGTMQSAASPRFPAARYVIGRDEWQFWSAEENLQRLPMFAPYVRAGLLPLRERIELVERESEIASGVWALEARGHTPGQMAVALVSGGQQLLYISDTVLHPIHLQEPEWYPVYDLDHEQAALTKRRLFDRAAAEHALVHAFHFRFPGLGYVTRQGPGWSWQPVEAEPRPQAVEHAAAGA